MKNKKKLLVSPFTNRIFLAAVKDIGDGKVSVIGNKEDYTDEAIEAVFQHMYDKAEETGFYEYEYPSEGKLQFIRARESTE